MLEAIAEYSPIGLTKEERTLTLDNILDDETLSWDGNIAYCLGEAIGQLTTKGEWNKAWTSYGLYSERNSLFSTLPEDLDARALQARFPYLPKEAFEALKAHRMALIHKIRQDLNNKDLRKEALAEYEAKLNSMKALNEQFKIEEGLSAIKKAQQADTEALASTELRIREAIDARQERLIKAETDSIKTDLKALAQADAFNADQLNSQRHALTNAIAGKEARAKEEEQRKAREFITANYLEWLKAGQTSIKTRGSKLSNLARPNALTYAKEILPPGYLPDALMNPWNIIPANITDWPERIHEFSLKLAKLLGADATHAINKMADRLAANETGTSTPWLFYRSKASFMITAATYILYRAAK